MLTEESVLDDSLTDEQWQIVHAIAQSLAAEQLEINKKSDGIVTEFKKTLTYLYKYIDRTDAEQKYFNYLKTLINNGNLFKHSEETPRYYRCIDRVCKKYLYRKTDNAQIILQILGWAARLIKYYKKTGVSEEFIVKKQTEMPKKNVNKNQTNSSNKNNPALARAPKPPKK